MHVTILTLFPEYFTSILGTSQLKKALKKKVLTVEILNVRDFATDSYGSVDDRPYGGGAGMVLKVALIDAALSSLAVQGQKIHKVLFSARGNAFDQTKARAFAQLDHLVLVCGHYTDVDQRVADHLVDEELRIGEYVLTGGEPAAAVVLDSVARLLPGVLGNEENLEGESFSAADLQKSPPAYTRPAEYKGWKVPQVLLTGNHAEIEAWKAARTIRNASAKT